MVALRQEVQIEVSDVVGIQEGMEVEFGEFGEEDKAVVGEAADEPSGRR